MYLRDFQINCCTTTVGERALTWEALGSLSFGMLFMEEQIVFMLGYYSSFKRAKMLGPTAVGRHYSPIEEEKIE